MPLYEYVCPKCGQPFEKLVRFADADRPQSCPACGSDRATKQISRVAFHATGTSGFSVGGGGDCAPGG